MTSTLTPVSVPRDTRISTVMEVSVQSDRVRWLWMNALRRSRIVVVFITFYENISTVAFQHFETRSSLDGSIDYIVYFLQTQTSVSAPLVRTAVPVQIRSTATCVNVYLVTQTCSVRQVSSQYNYILLQSYVSWCQIGIQDYVLTYYVCITPLFYFLPSLFCHFCRNRFVRLFINFVYFKHKKIQGIRNFVSC